jgi:hypothetical protein
MSKMKLLCFRIFIKIILIPHKKCILLTEDDDDEGNDNNNGIFGTQELSNTRMFKKE